MYRACSAFEAEDAEAGSAIAEPLRAVGRSVSSSRPKLAAGVARLTCPVLTCPVLTAAGGAAVAGAAVRGGTAG